MTESNERENENSVPTVSLYNIDLRKYKSHPVILSLMLKNFPRIGKAGCSRLLDKLFEKSTRIHADDINKSKSFIRYNLGKFDKDTKLLKIEEIKNLQTQLTGALVLAGEKPIEYDKEKHKNIKIDKEGDCYIVTKYILYRDIRKLICEEGDNALLKYDFSNPDMDVDIPKNTEKLQRCKIQIVSRGIKFDYPIVYEYKCPACNHQCSKKAYETASTKTKISCPGTKWEENPATGDNKPKICKTPLYPDEEISDTKNCFYYEMCYDDEEGTKQNVGAICFDKIDPGFYEAVLYKIKNPKRRELYNIIDVKPMITNVFNIPKKVEGENYIFTLQKEFDKFIEEQSIMNVYGLTVIKCALILQKVLDCALDFLKANIQIVGDASTGKSTVLKYYSFFLNSNFNLSTNAVSISVPSLRGTKETINLMGKDLKIITTGYLGTYKTIHIDEIAEDKPLQQNLKVFLLEDNYGYNKAGANENSNRRTAQINISENLDNNHVGQYIGSIRKAYKDDTLKIPDVDEKEPWDENWNFYEPLHKYVNENPYLYKVIKDKRDEYINKKVWWIDGFDYALHQRFPFYFYLTIKKENKDFLDVIKENASKNIVSENLELVKVLKSDNVKEFFEGLKKYKDSKADKASFIKVDKILDDYGLNADSRTRTFYYMLLRAIRIVNQRFTIEDEDYEILKWFIEKTNCEVDILDTVEFKVEGTTKSEEMKKKAEQIEDSAKHEEAAFDSAVDFDNDYS